MASPRNKFFGWALFGVSLLWCCAFFVFAWSVQRRLHREVLKEQALIFAHVSDSVSNAVVALSMIVPEVSSSSSSSSTSSLSDSPAPRYRILGSGQNRTHVYLDVRHANGEVGRYYTRKADGLMGALSTLDRIETDASDVLSGWDLFAVKKPLDNNFGIWETPSPLDE